MIVKTRTNVYDFNFHLVFVTKYRKEIFTSEEKRNVMRNILLEISKGNEVTILELEVLPEHIHMLISFPPKLSPSSVVKSFKGTSAREWFKHYPETKKMLWKGHLWSPSFYMGTVGITSLETVKRYIETQLDEYGGSKGASKKKRKGTQNP